MSIGESKPLPFLVSLLLFDERYLHITLIKIKCMSTNLEPYFFIKEFHFVFYMVPNFETLRFCLIPRLTISHVWPALGRVSQRASIFVIPVSAVRAEEFMQRPSSARIRQRVKFLFYNHSLEEGSTESRKDGDRKEPEPFNSEKRRLRHDFIIAFIYTKDGFQLLSTGRAGVRGMGEQPSLWDLGGRQLHCLTLRRVAEDSSRILFSIVKTISFFWRVGKMDRTVMLLKETSGKGGVFRDHMAPLR